MSYSKHISQLQIHPFLSKIPSALPNCKTFGLYCMCHTNNKPFCWYSSKTEQNKVQENFASGG